MNYLLKLWRNRKIQFDIISEFVVLLLATALSIMWYTFHNNTKNLVHFSDILVSEMAKGAIDNTRTYLDTAQKMTQLGAYLIADPKEVDINNESIILYMIGVLRAYPHLSDIYIGAENGNFLQVSRLDENATYRSHPSERLPGGISFSSRFIDRTKEIVEEKWQYRDEDGAIRESETISNVMYDHKIDDWYLKARQHRAFYWSDVYIFPLERKPGITASQPLYTGYGNSASKGDFFGVVGADIRIEDISKILQQAKLGKDGVAFIVDADGGELVAHPDKTKTVKYDGEDVQVQLIHDLDDKRLAKAFQHRLNTGKHKFTFEYNGNDYFALFAPFPEDFDKKWEVGIVGPTDVFLGAAKKTRQETIIISIVIFIISIIFIVLLSRNLSRPIVQLAKEANKIKNFDLQHGKEVASNVYEIKLLNQSISTMRKSLQAFGKFVPKGIVSKLTRHGTEIKVGGKLRLVTLLFTDIANFTNVSETYPPEKLMIHLSDYFEALTSIIQNNKGTIDKYIGDAIMAFWGAPLTDRNHVLNACISALHCEQRLLGLNRKWRSEGKPELATRFGIHTGDAIIGNVGSSDRVNYSAIGDTVNLAARLEGVNKLYDTRIIVSQDVYDVVHKSCLMRPLDVVAVKGKEKGVKIYELIGLKKGNPKLFPSRQQVQYTKMFTQGFKVYLERRWDEAIDNFSAIIDSFGHDHVCDLYIKRCEEFKKNPPPKGWDGLVKLTKK